MKTYQLTLAFLSLLLIGKLGYSQQTTTDDAKKNLYIDVHYIPDGQVAFAAVAEAHAKDLAVQSKRGVEFLKYWVDESKGVVYCLSSAHDTASISQTHKEAHGLLPGNIYQVKGGAEAKAEEGKTFFLDIHEFGPNKVTAADVEKAHEKDLAMQGKYGVDFINYWVDEKSGTVFCLSQASDLSKVIQTHKEAHGLIPVTIAAVKQGQ